MSYRRIENNTSIKFTEDMKISCISKIDDFEGKYLDNLTKMYCSYKKQDWSIMDAEEFIKELDSFLIRIYDIIDQKIYIFNKIKVRKIYEEYSKEITLEKLKQMTEDFTIFRDDIVTILDLND